MCATTTRLLNRSASFVRAISEVVGEAGHCNNVDTQSSTPVAHVKTSLIARLIAANTRLASRVHAIASHPRLPPPLALTSAATCARDKNKKGSRQHHHHHHPPAPLDERAPSSAPIARPKSSEDAGTDRQPIPPARPLTRPSARLHEPDSRRRRVVVAHRPYRARLLVLPTERQPYEHLRNASDHRRRGGSRRRRAPNFVDYFRHACRARARSLCTPIDWLDRIRLVESKLL